METIEYINLWLTYNLYLHYLSIKQSRYGVVYLPFIINKANKLKIKQSRFKGKKNKELFVKDYVKNYMTNHNPMFKYVFIFMANQIVFLQRYNKKWFTHFLFPSCQIYQELLSLVNPCSHIGHLSPSELALITYKTNFSLDYNINGNKQLIAEIINLSIEDSVSYSSPKEFAFNSIRNQREINSHDARQFFEEEFELLCNLIAFDYKSSLVRIRKKITQYDLEQFKMRCLYHVIFKPSFSFLY